jgi:membrane protein
LGVVLNLLRGIKSQVNRAAVIAKARYLDDLLSLWATSLTYTTLLSLVPFLAVAFSVLKAFGAQNFIEPMLAQMVQPLGPSSAEITERIIHFVNNIRADVLGGAGLAMLFYTVLTLLGNIEDALNQIWRVPRSRSWGRRFTAYLSVVLVGPVLVFTALALIASAQSYWLIERLYRIELVNELFILVTRVTPFALLCATFTFMYAVLPYTSVPLSSALVGGATAGILWQLASAGFTAFVANSGRYAAIYSSFAVAIVFLVWLYVGWLIFLVGAEVANFHYHPRAFVLEALRRTKTHRFRERLALAILVEIARRHLARRPPLQTVELASAAAVSSVESIVDEFVRANVLLRAAEPPGVALARPPDEISVKEILDVVAGADTPELQTEATVADVLMRRDRAVQREMEGLTLKSLITESQGKTLRAAQLPAH